jgi:hypothetical protein
MAGRHKFGFDADTVWHDPKNAQLRQAGHASLRR